MDNRVRQCAVLTELSGTLLNMTLGIQTAKPHELRLNHALDVLSPLDTVLRARLRKTIGDAFGEQYPLIIVRRNDCRLALQWPDQCRRFPHHEKVPPTDH